MNDKSRVDNNILRQLRRLVRSFNIHLTQNSPQVLCANGWMRDHFDLVGDKAPGVLEAQEGR